MEHDPAVLEFYDQPPPIKLTYAARNGRLTGFLHTPDFVIRADSVGWEEWKTEEELGHLAEKMPNRYVRAENGRWRCPPGEQYAGQFGFYYRVRSSVEIDWTFQRNMIFLEDYLRDDCPPVSEEARREVLALIAGQPGMTLDALLGHTAGFTSDDIYKLIAAEQIHVDLYAAPLAEPGRVAVFQNAATARAYGLMAETAALVDNPGPQVVNVTVGAGIAWDGRPWKIANVGETTT